MSEAARRSPIERRIVGRDAEQALLTGFLHPATRARPAPDVAAAASQITGTTFTKTKPSSVEGVVFNCEYDGPDSALLQITVDTQNGLDQLGVDLSALKTVGHPPAAISGVGDKAYSEPDPHGNAGSAGASSFASYGAVFGADYIKIGGLTYVTAAQGKQIVEQLYSKL